MFYCYHAFYKSNKFLINYFSKRTKECKAKDNPQTLTITISTLQKLNNLVIFVMKLPTLLPQKVSPSRHLISAGTKNLHRWKGLCILYTRKYTLCHHIEGLRFCITRCKVIKLFSVGLLANKHKGYKLPSVK